MANRAPRGDLLVDAGRDNRGSTIHERLHGGVGRREQESLDGHHAEERVSLTHDNVGGALVTLSNQELSHVTGPLEGAGHRNRGVACADAVSKVSCVSPSTGSRVGSASIGRFPRKWVQCAETWARRLRLFDIGLELRESLERLRFQCGGVAGDVGLANSLDLWLAPVECRDQFTQVTDLLLLLVVRWCIGHR